MSYPDGSTISNVYTALDVTARKDRLGQWSYFGFNGIRQMVAATNENGIVTRYGYCDCGALLSQTNAWSTPVQQPISFSYDNQGNLLVISYPDGYSVTNCSTPCSGSLRLATAQHIDISITTIRA